MTLRGAPAAVRSRLALPSERGSVLVEVMVGAVVLAIATFAILDGLDGAQATGDRNKTRSVQASLAQQDIERLRSIPVSGLSNLRQTRTVTVAGVDYTVVSRTDWVRDSTGVVTCSSDTSQATYLKLSSTVTSPDAKKLPVKETGLLTPSLGQLSESAGTATVRLTHRDGQPYAGLPVNLAGPGNYSDRTNELGCVVFGYIPAGTYTVTVPGVTEQSSDGMATEPLSVGVGQSSLSQLMVERPVSLQARFLPPIGQTFPVTPLADAITVKNANLPGVSKVFPEDSPSPLTASVEAAGLFPFSDGVAVYAGRCAANDPSSYAGQTNYFQNAARRGYTELELGDLLRSMEVEMPSIRVSVDTTSGDWRLAQLNVTPTDSTCNDSFPLRRVEKRDGNGDPVTDSTPVTFDLSLPFGVYNVCAATGTGTRWTNGQVRRSTTLVEPGNPVPTVSATLDLTKAPAPADRTVNVTTPPLLNSQECPSDP